MKITSKNDWKSASPTTPYECIWSIHYGPDVIAGWRKSETGEEFVYVYPHYSEEDVLVTRYKGRWWVLIVTEDVHSPSDAEDKLIGPFPSRKTAAAAMRML